MLYKYITLIALHNINEIMYILINNIALHKYNNFILK